MMDACGFAIFRSRYSLRRDTRDSKPLRGMVSEGRCCRIHERGICRSLLPVACQPWSQTASVVDRAVTIGNGKCLYRNRMR
jgi:hypothetical protein